MRKLLIASQKGGVGKTTTSINLAAATAQAGARVLLLDADPLSSISVALNLYQHPRRKPFRVDGIELPGVLVSSVVPGLDVVSPYEEGSCTDEDLDALLRVFSSPEIEDCYDCLLVGSPPFMGANAAQLLDTCDEFMIVMRAEAMACRTLPAFLELVQRNKNVKRAINLRGILLTLPEQDSQDGRWEHELRGRFGGRILPAVIPYDEEVRKALELGQIVLQTAPEAPASLQYVQLSKVLGLAETASGTTRGAEAPLLEVAATMQAAGLLTRERVPVAIGSAETIAETENQVEEPSYQLQEPEILPYRSATPAKSKSVTAARSSRTSKSKSVPVVERKSKKLTTLPRTAAASTPEHAAGQPWMVWIGLAASVVVGVGLRLVSTMPDFMMPLVVGGLVAAGLILLVKLLIISDKIGEAGSRALAANNRPAKPSSRAELKRESRSGITTVGRQRREARLKRAHDGN